MPNESVILRTGPFREHLLAGIVEPGRICFEGEFTPGIFFGGVASSKVDGINEESPEILEWILDCGDRDRLASRRTKPGKRPGLSTMN